MRDLDFSLTAKERFHLAAMLLSFMRFDLSTMSFFTTGHTDLFWNYFFYFTKKLFFWKVFFAYVKIRHTAEARAMGV